MYKNGQVIPTDDSLDYGANFSHMLGFDDPAMQELMRLYVTIHRCCDFSHYNVSLFILNNMCISHLNFLLCNDFMQ